ncbi:MAG: hypothetical protein FWC39_07215 [Bacteroidetes bacterium]|nr:hypothetical protein [Bacteroidota bacterium]
MKPIIVLDTSKSAVSVFFDSSHQSPFTNCTTVATRSRSHIFRNCRPGSLNILPIYEEEKENNFSP